MINVKHHVSYCIVSARRLHEMRSMRIVVHSTQSCCCSLLHRGGNELRRTTSASFASLLLLQIFHHRDIRVLTNANCLAFAVAKHSLIPYTPMRFELAFEFRSSSTGLGVVSDMRSLQNN